MGGKAVHLLSAGCMKNVTWDTRSDVAFGQRAPKDGDIIRINCSPSRRARKSWFRLGNASLDLLPIYLRTTVKTADEISLVTGLFGALTLPVSCSSSIIFPGDCGKSRIFEFWYERTNPDAGFFHPSN